MINYPLQFDKSGAEMIVDDDAALVLFAFHNGVYFTKEDLEGPDAMVTVIQKMKDAGWKTYTVKRVKIRLDDIADGIASWMVSTGEFLDSIARDAKQEGSTVWHAAQKAVTEFKNEYRKNKL